jgi:hypothetical protein
LLSDVYHLNSEDYLPLTIWTSQRPTSLPLDVETIPNTPINNIQKISSIKYQFTIDSSTDTQVVFNRYYFPGWQVKINNVATNIYPKGDLGVISFSVPSGNNNIIIEFSDTPIRKISNIISLITLILLITLPIIISKNESKK